MKTQKIDSTRIDIIVGIGLCIFSIVIFMYAEQYVGRGVNSYGPNFFPQAIAATIFLCSALMILQACRGKALKDIEPINKAGFLTTSITLGIAILYLVSMQYLGFILSTCLFLYIVMSYLKQKNRLVRVAVSIIVTLIIFAIFHYFLKIPLPEGFFYSN